MNIVFPQLPRNNHFPVLFAFLLDAVYFHCLENLPALLSVTTTFLSILYCSQIKGKKMGSPVALSALFLLLGSTPSIWSLNPDDPNVCSHWERWASSSALLFYSRLEFLELIPWTICYKRPQLNFNIYSQSPYGGIDRTAARGDQSQGAGRGCCRRWNTQANWSVYSHPNQSRQPQRLNNYSLRRAVSLMRNQRE